MLILKKAWHCTNLLVSIAVLTTFTLFFNEGSFAQSSRKIKTIIIDPGHGGEDNGARGEYEGTLGSKEKKYQSCYLNEIGGGIKKSHAGRKYYSFQNY